VKPSVLYEELADIVTQTVKRPYRDEEVTPDELDTIAERIATKLWALNPKSFRPVERPVLLQHASHVKPEPNCHLCSAVGSKEKNGRLQP
jgi:hypothetical protein